MKLKKIEKWESALLDLQKCRMKEWNDENRKIKLEVLKAPHFLPINL